MLHCEKKYLFSSFHTNQLFYNFERIENADAVIQKIQELNSSIKDVWKILMEFARKKISGGRSYKKKFFPFLLRSLEGEEDSDSEEDLLAHVVNN